jgi:hypothetical protein
MHALQRFVADCRQCAACSVRFDPQVIESLPGPDQQIYLSTAREK